ncbi:hypothetical protein QP028_01280 [Corynebacterium suedekumii]|nr:hypothetical protein QP028_01280 [Corynebacterium suedekumii]
MSNDYYPGATPRPEDVVREDRVKAAWIEAKKMLSTTPSVWRVLWQNFRDGMLMTMQILPGIMSVGFIGLVIAYYTPVFKIIGLVFYPLLWVLQVPDPGLGSEALSIGLSELFLPATLVAGHESEVLRFVIAVVSVSQVFFFSSMIPAVLATDIPLKIIDMVIIWFQRVVLSTIFAVPLRVPCRQLPLTHDTTTQHTELHVSRATNAPGFLSPGFAGRRTSVSTQHSTRGTGRGTWKFFVFSAVGIFAFFVPFTVAGTSTILLDHIVTGIQYIFGDFTKYLIYLMIIGGTVYPFATGRWKQSFAKGLFALPRHLRPRHSDDAHLQCRPVTRLQRGPRPVSFRRPRGSHRTPCPRRWHLPCASSSASASWSSSACSPSP